MPTAKQRIYFEHLDGMRFFCFLSVFFAHSFHTKHEHIKNSELYQFIKFDLLANANLGVNCFFVLSGFLITYLIIQEKQLNGQINIPRFWIRRILRIWPLYYFCVFLGFAIFPIVKSTCGLVPDESANLLSYLFFYNNFDLIQSGPPDASILWMLWSIAIEEQFYLFWPILLYILPIRYYHFPFIAIILLSIVFRYSTDDFKTLHYHTFSCIGDMAMGALGAWYVSEFPKWKVKIANWSKLKIGLIYLSFFLFYFFKDEILVWCPEFRALDRFLFSLAVLGIILEQNYAKHSLFKFGNFKRISQLGLISYGLYCLHTTGLLAAVTFTRILGIDTQLWQVFLLNTVIAISIVIIAAKLSYRFYERPFLKLKERFAYFTRKE